MSDNLYSMSSKSQQNPQSKEETTQDDLDSIIRQIIETLTEEDYFPVLPTFPGRKDPTSVDDTDMITFEEIEVSTVGPKVELRVNDCHETTLKKKLNQEIQKKLKEKEISVYVASNEDNTALEFYRQN